MHADDAHKLAEQHFATLVAALEAGRSDALVRYLETASRFHTYSFRNQCLIAAQCPTATRVALFVLPVVAAVAFALATGTPVYACPAASSGSGGCR